MVLQQFNSLNTRPALTHFYATRENGVLNFKKPVQVFDMREFNTLGTLFAPSVLDGSTNLSETFVIETRRITARASHENKGGPGSEYQFLEVSFHGDVIQQGGKKVGVLSRPRQSSNHGPSSQTCMVAIPWDWTPQMFLALVNRSVKRYKHVLLQNISLSSGGGEGADENRTTTLGINEIHNYFATETAKMKMELLSSAAYAQVQGGSRGFIPTNSKKNQV